LKRKDICDEEEEIEEEEETLIKILLF